MGGRELVSVVIESGGAVAEDASWLRLVNEDKHITLTELDAVLHSSGRRR